MEKNFFRTLHRWLNRFDSFTHRKRSEKALKRGKVATIIPYTSYSNGVEIRILARTLYLKPKEKINQKTKDFIEEQQLWKVRGWKAFTNVHSPNTKVVVSVAGKEFETISEKNGGVIDATFNYALPSGWHTAKLWVLGQENSTVETKIYVASTESKIGIISDIDDTVMLTMMPRPFVAAWNAFVRHTNARVATPGMAVFFERILTKSPDSPVFYLSTGAWNVAPALTKFLNRNMYPKGPLLLTDWGPTSDKFFRSGTEHKRKELARLAKDFPNIKWILVGDDGQHDADLYREFSEIHPDKVLAIVIRELSLGEAVLLGGRDKYNRINTNLIPWITGPDGATLWQQIKTLFKI